MPFLDSSDTLGSSLWANGSQKYSREMNAGRFWTLACGLVCRFRSFGISLPRRISLFTAAIESVIIFIFLFASSYRDLYILFSIPTYAVLAVVILICLYVFVWAPIEIVIIHQSTSLSTVRIAFLHVVSRALSGSLYLPCIMVAAAGVLRPAYDTLDSFSASRSLINTTITAASIAATFALIINAIAISCISHSRPLGRGVYWSLQLPSQHVILQPIAFAAIPLLTTWAALAQDNTIVVIAILASALVAAGGLVFSIVSPYHVHPFFWAMYAAGYLAVLLNAVTPSFLFPVTILYPILAVITVSMILVSRMVLFHVKFRDTFTAPPTLAPCPGGILRKTNISDVTLPNHFMFNSLAHYCFTMALLRRLHAPETDRKGGLKSREAAAATRSLVQRMALALEHASALRCPTVTSRLTLIQFDVVVVANLETARFEGDRSAKLVTRGVLNQLHLHGFMMMVALRWNVDLLRQRSSDRIDPELLGMIRNAEHRAQRDTKHAQKAIQMFWEALADDGTNVADLLALSRKIFHHSRKAEHVYISLLQQYPHRAPTIRGYAVLTRNVLMDSEVADELLAEADDLEQRADGDTAPTHDPDEGRPVVQRVIKERRRVVLRHAVRSLRTTVRVVIAMLSIGSVATTMLYAMQTIIEGDIIKCIELAATLSHRTAALFTQQRVLRATQTDPDLLPSFGWDDAADASAAFASAHRAYQTASGAFFGFLTGGVVTTMGQINEIVNTRRTVTVLDTPPFDPRRYQPTTVREMMANVGLHATRIINGNQSSVAASHDFLDANIPLLATSPVSLVIDVLGDHMHRNFLVAAVVSAILMAILLSGLLCLYIVMLSPAFKRVERSQMAHIHLFMHIPEDTVNTMINRTKAARAWLRPGAGRNRAIRFADDGTPEIPESAVVMSVRAATIGSDNEDELAIEIAGSTGTTGSASTDTEGSPRVVRVGPPSMVATDSTVSESVVMTDIKSEISAVSDDYDSTGTGTTESQTSGAPTTTTTTVDDDDTDESTEWTEVDLHPVDPTHSPCPPPARRLVSDPSAVGLRALLMDDTRRASSIERRSTYCKIAVAASLACIAVAWSIMVTREVYDQLSTTAHTVWADTRYMEMEIAQGIGALNSLTDHAWTFAREGGIEHFTAYQTELADHRWGQSGDFMFLEYPSIMGPYSDFLTAVAAQTQLDAISLRLSVGLLGYHDDISCPTSEVVYNYTAETSHDHDAATYATTRATGYYSTPAYDDGLTEAERRMIAANVIVDGKYWEAKEGERAATVNAIEILQANAGAENAALLGDLSVTRNCIYAAASVVFIANIVIRIAMCCMTTLNAKAAVIEARLSSTHAALASPTPVPVCQTSFTDITQPNQSSGAARVLGTARQTLGALRRNAAGRLVAFIVCGAMLDMLVIILLGLATSLTYFTTEYDDLYDVQVDTHGVRAQMATSMDRCLQHARRFALTGSPEIGAALNNELFNGQYMGAINASLEHFKAHDTDGIDELLNLTTLAYAARAAIVDTIAISATLTLWAEDIVEPILPAIDGWTWNIGAEPTFLHDRALYPERTVYNTTDSDSNLSAVEQRAIARAIVFDRRFEALVSFMTEILDTLYTQLGLMVDTLVAPTDSLFRHYMIASWACLAIMPLIALVVVFSGTRLVSSRRPASVPSTLTCTPRSVGGAGGQGRPRASPYLAKCRRNLFYVSFSFAVPTTIVLVLVFLSSNTFRYLAAASGIHTDAVLSIGTGLAIAMSPSRGTLHYTQMVRLRQSSIAHFSTVTDGSAIHSQVYSAYLLTFSDRYRLPVFGEFHATLLELHARQIPAMIQLNPAANQGCGPVNGTNNAGLETLIDMDERFRQVTDAAFARVYDIFNTVHILSVCIGAVLALGMLVFLGASYRALYHKVFVSLARQEMMVWSLMRMVPRDQIDNNSPLARHLNKL